MHHFVFCKKDDSIYNLPTWQDVNLGLDPFIELGAVSVLNILPRNTPDDGYYILSGIVEDRVSGFTGTITGSITGTGIVSGTINCGGLCEPVGLLSDDYNFMISDDDAYLSISVDGDFFVQL